MLFAEYTTPDFLAAIQDWWAIALGGLAVGAWLLRREVKDWKDEIKDDLRAEIQKATAPIHPDGTGGKSLADVHMSLADVHIKLDALARTDERTCARIGALEQGMRDHLTAHRAQEKSGGEH